ncbi:MAG: hypothetical protein K2K48_03820 [Anaeroplasmataceae bacterium]|nr:hypothetical protein [Anaeroplasmataceae bacterium]MDE6414521.1 hypothetical protein [Anaeroplasmataceae bacterium]
MKKVALFIVTLIGMFGCFLTGCKQNENLSDKEKTQILTAYQNTTGESYGTVDLYYGKHKGYIVFEMMSVLPAEKIVEIGNQVFVFSSQNDLWAFKDNSLILLEKLYDRGDLNDQDIENIHHRYLQEIKKSVNNYDTWYKSYQEKVESCRKGTIQSEQLKNYWSGYDTKVIKAVWEKQKGESCKIDYKLGKYDYSFVFVEVGTKEESKTIKVADYDFTYSKDFTIWVYKDRDIALKEEFITLEDAYTKGYLTKNHLQEIHNIFVAQMN